MLGFLTTLASLNAFKIGCYDKVPESIDYDGITGDVEWFLGPSWYCLLAAILLKPIDVIIHLLMPTPVEKRTKKDQRATVESDLGSDKELELGSPTSPTDLNLKEVTNV